MSLPSYRKPPLIEVVCGVQFQELQGFSSVHYGRFADRLKADYPASEDRSPLSEIYEQDAETRIKPIVVSSGAMPPLRRVFYVSTAGNYLIQLQPSRLLANWRKVKEDDEYPRFDAAFSRFRKALDTFTVFVGDENLGTITPTQYELTYINHIVPGQNVQMPKPLPDYLSLLGWPETPLTAAAKLKFPSADGVLHVDVKHGKRATDNKDVAVVDLTARGEATDDLPKWFAAAHERIVTMFTQLTTDDAHRAWERE